MDYLPGIILMLAVGGATIGIAGIELVEAHTSVNTTRSQRHVFEAAGLFMTGMFFCLLAGMFYSAGSFVTSGWLILTWCWIVIAVLGLFIAGNARRMYPRAAVCPSGSTSTT